MSITLQRLWFYLMIKDLLCSNACGNSWNQSFFIFFYLFCIFLFTRSFFVINFRGIERGRIGNEWVNTCTILDFLEWFLATWYSWLILIESSNWKLYLDCFIEPKHYKAGSTSTFGFLFFKEMTSFWCFYC